MGKPEEAEELNLLEDRLQGVSDTIDGECGDTLSDFVEWCSNVFSLFDILFGN